MLQLFPRFRQTMVHIHTDDKSKVSCYIQLRHTALNRAPSICDCDSQCSRYEAGCGKLPLGLEGHSRSKDGHPGCICVDFGQVYSV